MGRKKVKKKIIGCGHTPASAARYSEIASIAELRDFLDAAGMSSRTPRLRERVSDRNPGSVAGWLKTKGAGYKPAPQQGKNVIMKQGMSAIFKRILELIAKGEVMISNHGYEELAEDGLMAGEIIAGVKYGKVVEDYPEYPKGPCVLVLQHDSEEKPIHAVWGIPKHALSPAVLVTAYKPDQLIWKDNFLERRK